MQSKAKWSYLAGLIDGEGSIGTTKGCRYWTNKKGQITKYPAYSLVVSVSNNSLVLMKHLLRTHGGVYYPHKRSNPNANIGWLWMPKGAKNKKTLLLAVLPYLVIKREQALLALKWLEMGDVINPALWEEFHQKFLAMNKRGLSSEPNTPNNSDELKIETELIGDDKSAPVVTQDNGRTIGDWVFTTGICFRQE